MKQPIIDQSLLDQLPIGGPIFDFTFSDKIEENTGIFHNCYTMEDDARGCAMSVKIEEQLKDILN